MGKTSGILSDGSAAAVVKASDCDASALLKGRGLQITGWVFHRESDPGDSWRPTFIFL